MTWIEAIKVGVTLAIPTVAGVTAAKVLGGIIDYFWFADPPSE